MPSYPAPLRRVIASFKTLPGVGSKTAERFAFYFLTSPANTLSFFIESLANLKEKIALCHLCKSFKEKEICQFCDPSTRDYTLLCIVSSPKDVYTIEETGNYKGIYHVLERLLSPFETRSIENSDLGELFQRIDSLQLQELILAFDTTLEGDATAFYLKEAMSKKVPLISRLALGLPMGSPLDYVDEKTIQRAFLGRQRF